MHFYQIEDYTNAYDFNDKFSMQKNKWLQRVWHIGTSFVIALYYDNAIYPVMLHLCPLMKVVPL